MAEHDVAKLKRAYEVLGVPLSASALSIKHAYRRIAKRWHPDLYPPGTPSHDEAAHVMTLINEAYSVIEHAPLRYHMDAYAVAAQKTNGARHRSDEARSNADRDLSPITDRFEFWLRFVCGAFWGVVVGWRFFFALFEQPTLLAVVLGGLIGGCGFGAARYGDRFWHAILGRWRQWR